MIVVLLVNFLIYSREILDLGLQIFIELPVFLERLFQRALANDATVAPKGDNEVRNWTRQCDIMGLQNAT